MLMKIYAMSYPMQCGCVIQACEIYNSTFMVNETENRIFFDDARFETHFLQRCMPHFLNLNVHVEYCSTGMLSVT
jgi:hypothetical protein